VCRYCGRDLAIPKPLLEHNKELVKKAEDLTEQNWDLSRKVDELQDEVARIRAELAHRVSPVAYWAVHLAGFVLLPILLLLISHYLLTIRFDVNPIFLRVVSIVIPVPFGFLLLWRGGAGPGQALALGLAVGVIAVGGMLTIVGVIDEV